MASQALKLARSIARHLLRPFRPFLDDFLNVVPGVIHVGASDGQERNLYARLGLDVIWVEPIPDVFTRLEQNIAAYPKQRAIKAVLSEIDGEIISFNVASNNGESSSLLDFKTHSDDRPDITTVKQIPMETSSLSTIIREYGINLDRYPALVIDVQGAELLVLKGAEGLLTRFRYIKAEASEGEPYAGCCTPDELIAYLGKFGFQVRRKVVIFKNDKGARSYDIVFRRR